MKKKNDFWKIILIILAVLLTGLFAAILINLSVQLKAREYIIPEERATELQDIDCILVLGCGVYDDGTPSPMLYDRVTVGARLYHAGVSDRLLMSGDNSRKDYNEVAVMKEVAMYPHRKSDETGELLPIESLTPAIPSEVIFLDHAGFSTYESMVRARDIFQAKRIVIVTQNFHLERAVYIARTCGLDAYGVSADERAYRGKMQRDIREFAAKCKDFLWCILKVKPTYSGDPIPIHGTYPYTGWE